MEVKKNIKKMVSVCVGTVMVGASIVGAMAANLSDYPSPFVKDGKFNGFIVVGDQAKAEDVIGATDIAMSLQYSMTNTKVVSTDSGSSSVTVQGDAWKVDSSSKKLELGEDFTEIQSAIGKTELAALADGTVKAKNSANYEQELRFSATETLVFEEDSDNDKLGSFIHINNNDDMMTYKLTFKTAAESDVVDTTILDDLQDSSITMLGMDYTITDAVYTAPALSLTMMGGAVNDIMAEGDTKIFTIDGKDYEVTVDYISTTKCKVTINGDVSGSLEVGDSENVGGIDFGVRDIMENEAGEAAGGDKIEFYLGANKLVLEDSDVTDIDYDGTMTIGDDTMNNVEVGMKGSLTGTVFSLEMIQLNYVADDDYWLASGETLSSKVEEPKSFINWDIKNEGLTTTTTEDIAIVPSGDKKALLKVTVADGKVDIPLAYVDAVPNLRMGDSNNALVLDKSDIAKDQYFILTTGTAVSVEDKSYVLQYRGADSSTGDTTATLKFKNLASGETFERSYNIGAHSATLSLGGTEFAIIATTADTAGTDDFNIAITGGAVTNSLVTEGNARIDFDDTTTPNQVDIAITEVNSGDMLEDGTAATILASITIDGTDVAINEGVHTGLVMVSDPEDSDVQKGMTAYGATVTKTSGSSSPDKIEISWPTKQLTGQVFITSGATTSTNTEIKAGDITTQEIIKIDVGASVLASEIAGTETTKNLIIVGGPCANSAAAVIMGNPSNCVEGFTAGKATIKLYENNGKVAMLVAGATALDTRGASKYVAQYDTNKALFSKATKEITLTVASLNSITGIIPAAVTAPVTTNTTNTTTV